MAVVIIDDIPDPSVVKRVICKKCGCTLQYVPNDVRTYTTSDYTGGKDTYRYIGCAKCRAKVHVGY